MSNVSSEDSDSDDIVSDSEMDFENCNFLQVSIRNRYTRKDNFEGEYTLPGKLLVVYMFFARLSKNSRKKKTKFSKCIQKLLYF